MLDLLTLDALFRRGRIRHRDRIWVMGIVNVTPDSFFAGGRFADPEEAVEAGLKMLEDGADLLDIGGESTRPGAAPVDAAVECARVAPVARALARQTQAPLSVDTRRLEVAQAAFDAGADILNDVSALRRGDGGGASGDHDALARLAAGAGAVVVLTHSHGVPAARSAPPGAPADANAPERVAAWLLDRARYAEARGVARERIWLDPGFGFGKDWPDNRRLFMGLPEIVKLGAPVVVGASRKSFMGDALGLSADDRLEAGLSLAVLAAERGARIIRTHDVGSTRRALDMGAALGVAPSCPRASPGRSS